MKHPNEGADQLIGHHWAEREVKLCVVVVFLFVR